MNKKLLTLAIAASLAAPAVALADVTVYGKLDVSYNNIDADGAGFSNDNISTNSSRLGFKGTEKLGNGNEMFFQVETRVGASGSSAAWSGRNTFVGMGGDWGKALIGKHDTPFKILGRAVDFFESEQLGENRVLVNDFYKVNTAGGSPGWDLRVNTIAYLTPNLNGFSGAVAYVPDDGGAGAVCSSNCGAWSAMGMYANGPWMAGIAYENHDKGILAGTTDEDAWRFAGKYSANGFTVAGLYQDVNDIAGFKPLDGKAWSLGGSYDFGNNTVKLTYGEADINVPGAKDPQSDMWAIGLDHNFSKRSKIYITYANVDVNSAAASSLDSGGVADIENDIGKAEGGLGDDVDGWSIGLRHKF